jgi:hypothetical protein
MSTSLLSQQTHEYVIDHKSVMNFRWDYGGSHVYLVVMQQKKQKCYLSSFGSCEVVAQAMMTPVYPLDRISRD